MNFGAEYYDKELLIECIRFNTSFLELSMDCYDLSLDTVKLYSELNQLIDLWKVQGHEFCTEIELASDIIHMFNKKFKMLELMSDISPS